MQSSDSGLSFDVDASAEGEATRVTVSASNGESRTYRITGGEHADYLLFFDRLAGDFGMRAPGSAEIGATEAGDIQWRPLITSNLSERSLCGYGDPAVLKVDDGWVLTATSNDALDAFPILHSPDLTNWEHKGFIFPEGHAPSWTATGLRVADFW
ncbi:MAG TPA: hypothetical protein VKA61_09740, partial [Sphingomicrobium sp.]|nr:hypothetical protein [Sphingomicrobium sp.]